MGKKGRYDGVKEPKVVYPAQRTMRDEMESANMRAAVENRHDVKTIRELFDEEIGKQTSELTDEGEFMQSIPERCYEIINDPANHLVLSLQQWQVVQIMMERAMHTGYDIGMRSHG